MNQEIMTRAGVRAIARVCHQADRAAVVTDPPYGPSIPAWDDCCAFVRAKTVRDVETLIDRHTLTAWGWHEAWLLDMTDKGWTLGAEKDVEKMTHLSLMPWEKLSEAHRLKNILFVAIVRALTGPTM